MNPKPIVRYVIDACMVLLLPVLMSYNLTGNNFHELLGITIFVLFIAHLCLNWKWFGRAFAQPMPMNAARILQTAMNVILLLVMTGMMVSAVLVSRLVFPFEKPLDGLFARKVHVCLVTWGFILMSIHLGFHWHVFVNMANKCSRIYNKRLATMVARGIAFAISIYGVISSFVHDFGAKLTMYYGFSFWDPEGNALLFIADHFAIMGLYTFIGYYSFKALHRNKKNP